jgi:hypothetical protein
MTDGTALLWRVRLDAAAPAALPWRALADIAGRVSRPGYLFGECHAALAYAACGDQAALEKMMDGLRALDAKGNPIAGRVVLPLVQGTAAFALRGDHGGVLPRARALRRRPAARAAAPGAPRLAARSEVARAGQRARRRVKKRDEWPS